MRKGQKRKEVEEIVNIPEMADFEEFYQPQQTQVDRAILKLFTKSIPSMKIIRLLQNTSTDLYKKQIDTVTKIGQSNSHNILRRLTAAGIIERFVPTPVDMKKVFYRIPDKELTAKMIKHYYRLCSFTLANAVPFNQVSIEELKKNRQLFELCQKFDLSFEEAISALEMNKTRIEAIYSERERGKLVGFRRKLMASESWSLPESEKEEKKEEVEEFEL